MRRDDGMYDIGDQEDLSWMSGTNSTVMTNAEIFKYFRETGEASFPVFLDKYIQFDIIEQETCGFCVNPCGNTYCPVITGSN